MGIMKAKTTWMFRKILLHAKCEAAKFKTMEMNKQFSEFCLKR